MALSIVTGFARVYGWPSPPTVLTTCLLGGTVLLLDTPLWTRLNYRVCHPVG